MLFCWFAKIIMLQRIDSFKTAMFFTWHIISFNERMHIVPLGDKGICHPIAIIWHEGVAGPKKIISAFNKFFLENRDKTKITLWLDNYCSGQNKNWALFIFFTYIVSSRHTKVACEEIEVKYFEPGHTFMIADSFHPWAECSLTKSDKVYDFMILFHVYKIPIQVM